ncbi:MAG: hypothetical protein GTO04_06930, partial [Planctomycetales bacterium]|nr:hypothetical protein [Planctomycetales bacterium]
MISKRIWIGCVGLLFCTTALADQLILINGDRITGTISRVWDAEITIEPDYADEFKVEISAVKSII